MIHLFSKVYLAHDSLIDMHYDRVVISESNGVVAGSLLDDITNGNLLGVATSYEEMIGEGKQFDTLISLLTFLGDKVKEHGGRVFIFTDASSFIKFASNWFSTLLPNIDQQHLDYLTKSLLFKYNMFHRGARSTVSTHFYNTLNIDTIPKIDIASTEQIENFFQDNGNLLSIEYLIASYLYDGSYKEELKESFKKMYKKSLEQQLIDMKEVFVSSATNRGFNELLELSQTYTIHNLSDIVNEESVAGQLFFSERLWADINIKEPTSTIGYSNINVYNITSEDVQNFNWVLDKYLESSGFNTNNVSIPEKITLDYISVFNNFTDELLDQLLQADKQLPPVYNIFFSPLHETVNFYLIKSLYQNLDNNNTDFLNQYRLR